MKKEVLELREKMKENGIDVYFVPSGDYHSSEYVNDFFKAREFMSGLTGESGELIVDSEGAYLWTDGRYFLQAEHQLAGSEIELMRMAEPGVPTVEEFLENLAKKNGGYTLGFDGQIVNGARGNELKKLLEPYGVSFKYEKDLVGEIWADRPAIKPSKIYELPLETVGLSADQKIAAVRKIMAEERADYLLVSDLMESAWLFNLRGADIDYTPVFFGYTLLSQDDVKLYVMDGALDKMPEDLSYVKLDKYENIGKDLAAIPAGKKLWLDENTANYKLTLQVADGVELMDRATPISIMKAVKNDTEIESTLNAHVKDGIAMTNLLYWVRQQRAKKADLTEIDIADKLWEFRKEQGAFDLSFETISGYGPNGSIIHYAPTPETNAKIEWKSFLLLDSGGHYEDGTTDITRTLAMGPLTQEEKDDYTYVLKSHIAMATAVLTPDMNGLDIDRITRQPLRDVGLDFKHGLSHGIGHLLSVHEGPNILRRVPTPCQLLPGMVMSDEPGVYIDNKFGVRIENEVLLYQNDEGNTAFQSITYCPYESEAINVDLLSDEEIDWVNEYNAELRETLTPYLDEDVAKWLIDETKPLSR